MRQIPRARHASVEMPRNTGSLPPPSLGPTEYHSNTPSQEPEDGSISPTFAQFAYLDSAVRKTRNRAYQKHGGNEGSPEGTPNTNGKAVSTGRVPMISNPRPRVASSSSSKSAVEHEPTSHPPHAAQATVKSRNQAQGCAVVELSTHESPQMIASGCSSALGHQETIETLVINPRIRIQSEPEHHTAQAVKADEADNEKDEVVQQELEKRNHIIYGFPITLLTSPPRNWMPVLDKKSLMYQALQEIMNDCRLPNAVPMLARRSTWKGKGKAQGSRVRRTKAGKFTKGRDGRKTAAAAACVENTQPEQEEWSLEGERKGLLGGILDIHDVIDGIEAADKTSVNQPGEFVDVDIPIPSLLAGTESIVFTNLGFYRILVPEKNTPFTLNDLPKPSRQNWDPFVSKIDRAKPQPPWLVTFLGYEWETVRTELLDEDGPEEADQTDLWVSTMAGFRTLKYHEEVVNSGGGLRSNSEPVPLVIHPWGRDVIEPPPVGIYATTGGYEGVVRNWFPWAWDVIREASGTVTGEGRGGKPRRKAALRADQLVCGAKEADPDWVKRTSGNKRSIIKGRVENSSIEQEDEGIMKTSGTKRPAGMMSGREEIGDAKRLKGGRP